MPSFTVFRLTRYFSIVSFLLMLLAGGALGLAARYQATQQLTRMAEGHNEAISQVFLNALWPHFSPLVQGSQGRSADELRASAQALGLHAKTASLMRHSDIVKVKVYNRQGLTVYSSDPKQIGDDKRANQGFVSALAGKTASELAHRNQFSAFEEELVNIDLLSSYLPIHDNGRSAELVVGAGGGEGQGAHIVGVIELYQDVTPFVRKMNQALLKIVLGAAGVLLTLYLMQLLIVRYAQKILRRQEADLQESNRVLDARVADRTRELADTNHHLEDEVVERRRAEARLDHLAHHDPLTGLPNRLLFAAHVQRSVAKAERGRHQLAVLFIDLDRFKAVNDTLGHAVGDELLVEVTRRLTSQLRSSDVLARLGGDEFVCVLEEVEAPQDASRLAEKLIAHLSESFTLGDHELNISASIGISIFPSDGLDADNLLRAADTAMYQAKKQGHSHFHFYTPEMTQYAQERSRMERLLRHSIEHDELEVHYQIKVSAQEGRPIGVEALVRWNSAELGPVSPVRFIPVAEETGFIVKLGEWVLRTACLQMAAWRATGVDMHSISVNLSVRQLERPDIVEMVKSALQASGLPPQTLELEITESVIMNVEDAIGVLQQLSNLGVRLAVDDFGTGYSSLAYLKLLPINTLKIDRAFVVGIGDNLSDEAIIQAVIGMARSLGLSTVAEGVETPAQLAFLRQAGCDQIQGYLFGKPLPMAQFSDHWNSHYKPTSAP